MFSSHINYKSASCIVEYTNSNEMFLYLLVSQDKGKGHAKKVIQKAKQIANTFNFKLKLVASPYTKERMPFNRLIRWYKTQGFKIERVYRESSCNMYYQPPLLIENRGINEL